MVDKEIMPQKNEKNADVQKSKKNGDSISANKVEPENNLSFSEHEQVVPVNRRSMWTLFDHNLYKLAKLWMQLLSAIASALFLGVISTTVGLNTLGPAPLLDIIRRYPIASIIVGSIFVGISLLAWFLAGRPALNKDREGKTEPMDVKLDRSMLIATLISTTSCALCFTLISVVLLRPPWCPTILCPAPKLILQSHGVHDENIEVYLQTVQSSTHMLTDDPAVYTPNFLPTTISVQRVDISQQEPYRVVIGIHSLQQGRYGLIIEQVSLLLSQITLIPYPLHVWMENEIRDYHSNLYQALYRGQRAKTALPAVYVLPDGRIGGHVQLIPGESDELDIQVMSHIIADLHFQVQVTYRVINESQERSITLPDSFELIFSNAANWHPYHLQDGHLIANS